MLTKAATRQSVKRAIVARRNMGQRPPDAQEDENNENNDNNVECHGVTSTLTLVRTQRALCRLDLTNQSFTQERLHRSQRGIGEHAIGFPRPHYREKWKDQFEPAKPAEI